MKEIIKLSIAVILLIGFGSVISQSEEDGEGIPEESNTVSCNFTTVVNLKEASAEYKWLFSGFLSVFRKHIKPLGEKFKFSIDNLLFNTTSDKLAGTWKFEFHRSSNSYGRLVSANLKATYITPYTCQPQPESPTSAISKEESMNVYDRAWDSYEIGFYKLTMQIIVNDTVQYETIVRKQEERPSLRSHYDYENDKVIIESPMPCDKRTVSFGENYLNLDDIFDGFGDLNDAEIRFGITAYTVGLPNIVQSTATNLFCG